MKPLAFVAFVLPAALAAPARAQEAPSPPAPESPQISGRTDRRDGNWRGELGYRGSFVTNAGYQPFSSNGYFPEFSLAASRTLLARGRFSFAAGLAWDTGSSSSTVRQVDGSSLGMQRFTVTLEGRVHVGPWGYVYLRAAPGAAWEKEELDDSGSPAPLQKSAWLFATDVSAGYAWLLWPRGAPTTVEPRAWLQGEGGYGWVAGQKLALAPALPSNSPVQAAGADLGSLAMEGGFFRVAVAVSF